MEVKISKMLLSHFNMRFPLTEAEAFFVLACHVHADGKPKISITEYCNKTGWGRDKTRMFFNKLAEDGILANDGTQFMIAEKLLLRVKKEEKKKEPKVFMKDLPVSQPTDPIDARFAKYMWDKLNVCLPGNLVIRKATQVEWEKEVRLMLSSDRRDPKESYRIFNWMITDKFWSKNCQSAPSFRIKYDKIKASYLTRKGGDTPAFTAVKLTNVSNQ